MMFITEAEKDTATRTHSPADKNWLSLWSKGEIKKSIAASCSKSIRQCLPPISPEAHQTNAGIQEVTNAYIAFPNG